MSLCQLFRDWKWRRRFLSCGQNVSVGNPSFLVLSKVSVGDNTRFNDGAWLYTVQSGTITIGRDCQFGAYNHISSANKIVMGDNVLTGKWVTIIDNNHGNSELETLKMPPKQRPIVSKGVICIADDVWIGDKATILSGVNIGKGAVVAANAVVSKDVPPYCVVAGNPARIIKDNR